MKKFILIAVVAYIFAFALAAGPEVILQPDATAPTVRTVAN